MRRQLISLIGLFLLVALMPGALRAQDDVPTCERDVQAAAQAAAQACTGLNSDTVCYGSGSAAVVSRFLNANLTFDAPGDTLEIAEIESVETLPTGTAEYSIVVMDLSVGGQPEPVRGVLFGEGNVVNNVVPGIEVPLTTSTVATVQAEPTDISQTNVALIPGDAVTATGRTSTDADAWLRVTTSSGGGWLPANVVNEPDLLENLPVVSPDDPAVTPMQQLTVTSERDDRRCATAPDSGFILQSPDVDAAFTINGLAVELAPRSTIFVQGRGNRTVDISVVSGELSADAVDVVAGQQISLPVGIDAQVTDDADATVSPTDYDSALTDPLILLADLLPAPTAADETGEVSTPEVALALATNTPAEQSETSSEVVAAQTTATPLPPKSTAAAVAAATVVAPTVPPTDAEPVEPVAAAEVEPTPVPAQDVTDETTNAGAPAALSASSAYAQTIRERGIIRVGVNGSLPTFSAQQDGEFIGFEPDLAREVVARLFGEEVTIEFVAVSSRERSTALSDGSVDLLMRNTGFTPDRETWGAWTNTFYFVDGLRLMVPAGSTVTGIDTLSGQAVGVQPRTEAETALNEIAPDAGVTVTPIAGALFELVAALDAEQVPAVSSDWTALEALRQASETPDNYQIVGNLLTESPWNAVVPSEATAFRDEIDAALLSIVQDGTWRDIYDRHFPNTTLPATLELVFAPGATESAAADTGETDTSDAPDAGDTNDVAAALASAADAAVSGNAEATPVPAEAVEPTPAPTEPPAEQPAPTATVASADAPPITGEIPVNIYTALGQERAIRITPRADGTFQLELIRNGEIVYDAVYDYYEDSGRYENIRNSFEYVEFSDTAGDTSLGCEREPDIRGFFNGADFDGRVGC